MRCLLYSPALTNACDHREEHALTMQTRHRAMSLLLNTPSRLVIAFLPRSNCLRFQGCSQHLQRFWSWRRGHPSLLPHFPPACHAVMVPDAMILGFLILSFKPALSRSSFTLIKRLFSSSSLSAIRVVSSAYLRLSMFLPAVDSSL